MSFSCAMGTYKFSRDGGAVGTFSLLDVDHTPVVIPEGSVIVNAFAVCNEALTSGGLATVDFNSQAANDLLAAEAFDTFTLGAKVQGIPDFATLADSIVTTADKLLTMSINVAPLTAGEIAVYVFYV